jgi:3-deoxy-7-phosphoheptulonate synthase
MPFPSPLDLKTKLPLNIATSIQIQKHRIKIQEIIEGTSSLWTFVVGPCSLHDKDSALRYAEKLKKLQEKVEKTCLLVMRAHIEKPRTSLGWKGFLYDPYLDGSNKILDGLFLSRQLYLEIAEIGLPIATEFLEPLASSYFSDLISWGFIGARTSSSQIHRQLASLLQMPVGFKNSTDGNLESAIQGAISAQSPHNVIHMNNLGKVDEVTSPGNPFSHIVLRGSTSGPNYSSSDVFMALKKLDRRLLIDCAHDNSPKKPFDQKQVCLSALEQHLSGSGKIMGVMLEGHLKAGNQSITSSSIDPSVSLTDPCMGWDETEELIYLVHEALQESSVLCSL